MSTDKSSTALEALDFEELHTKDDERELEGIVERILVEAKQQGATAAEVGVGDVMGLSVTARDGDVETVEFSADRGFAITVYVGERKGNASTTDAQEESIIESVTAALQIAKHTEPDPYSGLADPDRLATEFPDLNIYHPRKLDVDSAKDQALEAEDAAMSLDERMYKSDGAHVNARSACSAYGNSHGFLRAERSSTYGINAEVIAKSEFGMQRDYWYSAARRPSHLESPATVGKIAAQRTLRKLDPRPIQTSSYPVLFESPVAAGLIGHLMSAISGRALYLNSSYLLNSMGTEVATKALTLREYPFMECAAGSKSYDSEGVASSEKAFVEEGVVQNYVLSSYSGRHLNMPTTGNAGGVSNLCIEAELQPVEEVIKQMGRGLVVTSVMGQGVNVVTGDYSRGASGYWIENGEFAHEVDEITIAAKLDDIYKNMVAFCDDVDTRPNIRTGSILVESMTVAAN